MGDEGATRWQGSYDLPQPPYQVTTKLAHSELSNWPVKNTDTQTHTHTHTQTRSVIVLVDFFSHTMVTLFLRTMVRTMVQLFVLVRSLVPVYRYDVPVLQSLGFLKCLQISFIKTQNL